MNICYVPSDMDAPGCYRCLFPARQLTRMGHTVTMPPYEEVPVEDDKGVRRRVMFEIDFSPPNPMADLYVLQQRKERLWAEEGVNALRRWGVCTVTDVDDNYEELPEWNPAFLGTHPYRRDDGVILNRKARRELEKRAGWGAKVPMNAHNREHMNRTLQLSDAVTVSTPYLADLYSRLNPNIYVVRNYLDWDIWEDIQPQYEVERERLRIGYLGVFSYRKGDLNVIRATVSKFMKRHPEIDFVANSDAVHDFLHVPVDQRVVIPEYGFWPPPGEHYPVGEKTAVLDIGLVPLAMNGLNQGKSHLKGMEYNAAGVPFIASPTESYESYWCEPGANGLLAYNEKDWMEAMEYLVADHAARRSMGVYGREKAYINTFQKQTHRWENVYKKILGDDATNYARKSLSVGAVQKVSELENLLRLSKGAKTVVEIGSARGGTYWALVRMADPKALLVSIDIPAGSPIDVRNGKDVYKGRPQREKIAEFALPGQTPVLIDANSQLDETVGVLKRSLGRRKIDVLFIDGDHRYEGVKRDFELYSPLVKKGGLIFFHDMIPQNDKRSGVHLLWAELKQRYRTDEWVGHDNWGVGQWGGIGVIYW